jgi:hypothetical protein
VVWCGVQVRARKQAVADAEAAKKSAEDLSSSLAAERAKVQDLQTQAQQLRLQVQHHDELVKSFTAAAATPSTQRAEPIQAPIEQSSSKKAAREADSGVEKEGCLASSCRPLDYQPHLSAFFFDCEVWGGVLPYCHPFVITSASSMSLQYPTPIPISSRVRRNV